MAHRRVPIESSPQVGRFGSPVRTFLKLNGSAIEPSQADKQVVGWVVDPPAFSAHQQVGSATHFTAFFFATAAPDRGGGLV